MTESKKVTDRLVRRVRVTKDVSVDEMDPGKVYGPMIEEAKKELLEAGFEVVGDVTIFVSDEVDFANDTRGVGMEIVGTKDV